jgi:excisionase family DNA binding protein
MTYLTVSEVSRVMNLAARTVRAHCKSGRLPSIRVGRDYYVDADDARLFEQRHAGRPTERERAARKARDAEYLERREAVRVRRELQAIQASDGERQDAVDG